MSIGLLRNIISSFDLVCLTWSYSLIYSCLLFTIYLFRSFRSLSSLSQQKSETQSWNYYAGLSSRTKSMRFYINQTVQRIWSATIQAAVSEHLLASCLSKQNCRLQKSSIYLFTHWFSLHFLNIQYYLQSIGPIPKHNIGFEDMLQTDIILMESEQTETFVFNIDRGGTFTDFYVQDILHNHVVRQSAFKVPSQSSLGQGPIVGIQRYLAQKGVKLEKGVIPVRFIHHINLGTTIATNALLERKGCQNAMILTEGFGDLLTIRHQARPNIFDLKCQTKPTLATHVIEISERTYLHSIQNTPLIHQQTQNGKQVFISKPTEQELDRIVAELKKQNVKSVGISLCNSYLSSQNQTLLRDYLTAANIQNIELGSSYKDLGYLKRSETASLDAFLNPIMKQYFQDIYSQFDEPQLLTLRVMKSDGGFDRAQHVKASQLLLSGPAGGLIGCKEIIPVFEEVSGKSIKNLICLDMGGTSTDVSRIEDRQFATKYSFQIQGIEICTPHLEIETIAAGGGSKLTFQNGMFVVGPESVGSNPGPMCYGIGSQLALTDANLILNRLDSAYFPKIFGKDRNLPLDKQASIKGFQQLSIQINANGAKKTIQEIAEGYISIGNELMAKSARKLLTMGVPDALVIFGSAGGQHCCDLAQKIGVKHIFIHRYSGILSAYGLSKAVEAKQYKYFLGRQITRETFDFNELRRQISQLKTHKQTNDQTSIEQIGIGYHGTSYTIKVPFNQKMLSVFEEKHKMQNGFSLSTHIFQLEYFTERLIKVPEQFTVHNQQYQEEQLEKYLLKRKEVFLQGRFRVIPYYDIEDMKHCNIEGPALLLSSTSSILVKENWTAKVTHQVAYITESKRQETIHSSIESAQIEPDPIKLTLYSTRLMSIAQEMGKVLQKISISTNIRERLDFSCGIFDWNGKLLANAPHLPVHLGSMETAVTEQINRGIEVGDIILTNHPNAGGSHLPDLTVVSCTQIAGTRMYLASRGHHADIGGITPGSMPAFSKSLSEEGVAIQKFKLFVNNQFQQADLRQLFKQSRRQDDNVSDLLAQVAANEMGAKLLKKLIEEYGVIEFKTYVRFICENAAESVRKLLYKFSVNNKLKQVDTLTNVQYMDDGTPIKLQLTIDRKERRATFDFSGTGPEVLGNTNAPRSITRSAILYSLRSLIGQEIPLNSGCLTPLTIIIPDNTILSPSKQAAVVGGNVETSQKLVDLILKPFQFVACSQGTMNNFLFGAENFCYYQTICGGSGAGEGFHGVTTQCHMTNTRITDIEYLQSVYPVIVTQFRERKGSGGKGRYRGGNGVVRELMFLEEVTVSVLSERRVFSGYGLKGGENGAVGLNIFINHDKVRKNIGGKNSFKVGLFETVRIETPGGGGYGVTD